MRSPGSGPSRELFLAHFGKLFPREEWPAPKLEALLDSLNYRSLEAGATILREGQTCGSVPFVMEGAIRIFKVAESGREIALYRIEAGQSCILSLGCLSASPSFPATVVAEKPTLAAFVPHATVNRFFAEGASFRAFVLDQYARRMTEVIELVEEVAFRKVDERLAQYLSEVAASQATDSIAATHQTLADRVGTSREVVSRILKDWEGRGLLEISRGSLRLLPAFADLPGRIGGRA